MIDYTELSDYIAADAAFAEFIAGGNDQQIADAINARTVPVIGTITRGKFAQWCAMSGLRAAILDHATNPQSPLRSLALTIQDYLTGGVTDPIDFADAGNRAMLQAWVDAGVLTTDQSSALLQLATTDQPVFGQRLGNRDVAVALGRKGL